MELIRLPAKAEGKAFHSMIADSETCQAACTSTSSQAGCAGTVKKSGMPAFLQKQFIQRQKHYRRGQQSEDLAKRQTADNGDAKRHPQL